MVDSYSGTMAWQRLLDLCAEIHRQGTVFAAAGQAGLFDDLRRAALRALAALGHASEDPSPQSRSEFRRAMREMEMLGLLIQQLGMLDRTRMQRLIDLHGEVTFLARALLE